MPDQARSKLHAPISCARVADRAHGKREPQIEGFNMAEGSPVLDTLADMTAASIARADLSPEALLAVRLAALVAVDAPPASYLVNFGAAADTELTLEDAQSILVAVAPIVGAPKVISAAGNIARALGLALALDDLADEI